MNKKGFVSIIAMFYLLVFLIILKHHTFKVQVHHELVMKQNFDEIYLIQYCRHKIEQDMIQNESIEYEGIIYDIELEEDKIIISNNLNQLIITYDQELKRIKEVYYP